MLGLLLGFRNWDSSPTPDFARIEDAMENGCLGGFEEEGFCFEADAILTHGDERECVRGGGELYVIEIEPY